MAFTLPSDLSTSFVDNSSTVDAAYFNGVSAMGNALKSAVATWGFNTQTTTVAASESTTSTTYTDLTTTTDQVTAAIGSSGKALVIISCSFTVPTGNGVMSYAISGANTVAATDTKCLSFKSQNGSSQDGSYQATFLETGLTAGFTTFKLKYRSSDFNFSGGGGTQTFSNRRITVIPFPSTDGTHASASFSLNLSSSLSLGMGGAGVNRPTYDSVGAGYKAGGSSGSWSHTIGSNAKALVVPVLCNAASGVTANIDGTTPLTMLCSPVTITTGGTLYLYLFGMLNPPTGAHTISVANASNYLVANSATYNNVAGFGSPQAKNGTGTTSSLTFTTSTPGRMVFNVFASMGNNVATAYNQTERWNAWQGGSTYPINFGDTVSATAATTFSTTNSTSNGWAGVAVELMPTVPTYSKPTWVGTGGGVGHVGSTSSWTDTVPADANLAVLWVTSLPTTLSKRASATLGGTAMVEVTGSPWQFELSGNQLQCFVLQNPATGPGKTVQVTWTGEYNINANMVYYGGVTSVGTASPAKGLASTNPSMTVASQTNHLYAQAFCYKPSPAGNMAAYSANLRATWPNVSYDSPLAIGDAMGTGGTLAFTATRSDTAYMWAGAALDLSPAALPTPSTPTWVGTGAGGGHLVGPSISWVDTIPANANCAIVWLATDSDSLATATVTIGGSAATAMSGSPWAFRGSGCTIQGFYLLNPPTGANKTIAVSYSGNNWINASSVYYGGVSGVWNPTAATGAGATQPVMSVPNSQSNHLYCQAISYGGAAGGNTITAYDQTRRAEWACNYYDNPIWVGDAVGNDGTLAFNATRGNTSYEWGGVVVDLSPVAQRTASLNLAVTPAISMSAWKPVLFDAVGASGYNSSGTSFSWTHVIAADANAVLACCTIWCPGYGITVTATVGSTPMTQLSAISDWSSGVWHYQKQYTFGLLNPPTGTQTITVTIAGTDCMSVGNSVSYKNVEAFGTPVTSSETGTTATTTVASNIQQMVVVAFASALSDPPSTVGSYTSFNQTVRSNIAGGANYPPIIIGDAPGATSVTFTATKPNSSGGGIAVPVRAASGYGAFNLGVTPAISMVGTRNNYPAEVNLPFMSTIGMSGVGHSGS